MYYAQEYIKPYNTNDGKAEQIRTMFNLIAPMYDKLNNLLSLGLHSHWREKAVNTLVPCKPKRLLDIATGTGDLAILAYRILQPDHVIGVDISEEMMTKAKIKVKGKHFSDRISFQHQDCLSLSFDDDCFDAVTVAFGVRNFENLDLCLYQMYRVLRTKGHLVILELSTPIKFPFKQLFNIYNKFVIPMVGGLFGHNKKAYTYLTKSIEAFPQGEQMQRIIGKAGFQQVRFKRLTFGICTLYCAEK